MQNQVLAISTLALLIATLRCIEAFGIWSDKKWAS